MIGDRLKRAREAAGFSLRDLEDQIEKEVSAQAIGKYERNEMMPTLNVLLRLAKALKVTPEFLLGTRDITLVGVDFRKATRAGAKEVKSVEAMVLDHIERYLELEFLVPGADSNGFLRLAMISTYKRLGRLKSPPRPCASNGCSESRRLRT